MKRVILLGSSGSIGTSACKVARELPGEMKLVGLAVNRSSQTLLKQAAEFLPDGVAVVDPAAAAEVAGNLPTGCRMWTGEEGLVSLVRELDADMVLVAIVGTGGLRPALAALETGKDLAVASKEILVMAGAPVMDTARRHGRAVLPVDSEHNAIFQCLQGANGKDVKRLILTASGGPFRQLPADQLASVTIAQALKHPTWSMGQKITIDSATLFNKGLEMIEARWLFHIEMAHISVVVHPQSIVHSMVEFVDHSILAQLSHSDMCFPIQYAVTYPRRSTNQLRPLDLAEIGSLHFEAPDPCKFPALRLAREAGTVGGTLPAVLNAANEVAVEAFLTEKCPFPKIWHTVESVMREHPVIADPSLDAIIQADQWARQQARAFLA